MTGTSFRPALRSVRDDDRWCTPSLIDYDAADSRLDDVSVSYARFGSPVEHSHCFDALESAVAEARKAVRAWLLVDGSTGGNRATGLSAWRLWPPGGAVLLAREAKSWGSSRHGLPAVSGQAHLQLGHRAGCVAHLKHSQAGPVPQNPHPFSAGPAACHLQVQYLVEVGRTRGGHGCRTAFRLALWASVTL